LYGKVDSLVTARIDRFGTHSEHLEYHSFGRLFSALTLSSRIT